MTTTWFECKVRYEKTLENGTEKKVTDAYIVDALSFTEAESSIIEEVTPFISGEFTVSDIKRVNYAEIFRSSNANDDRYFKVKLNYITLDEKSGKEKKTGSNVLVQAHVIDDALKYLHQQMKGSMADYVVASVAETAYMDIVMHKSSK